MTQIKERKEKLKKERKRKINTTLASNDTRTFGPRKYLRTYMYKHHTCKYVQFFLAHLQEKQLKI